MSGIPKAPPGYRTLNHHDGRQTFLGTGATRQVNHLIVTQSQGTLCGLTLFDRDGRPADIPGWSVGGGVSGPGIEQVPCEACWTSAAVTATRRDS